MDEEDGADDVVREERERALRLGGARARALRDERPGATLIRQYLFDTKDMDTPVRSWRRLALSERDLDPLARGFATAESACPARGGGGST